MFHLLFDLLMRPIETLFSRIVGLSADTLSKSWQDDAVYKKNVQDLIERNRRFEKSE
jgi:hypothetical protein